MVGDAKTMSVQQVFKASDGSEHGTKTGAEKRNKLLAARGKLDEAIREVQRCLKASGMSADGVPLTELGWKAYWLMPNYFGAFPEIKSVYLSDVWVDVDVNRYEPVLRVRYYDSDRKEYVTHNVQDLYANEEAAKVAHLKACEERFEQHKERLEELRKSK
jgi:hypothetical protein